jgi:hypothetical protein
VVLLADIIQQQSLEIPLRIEDAENGLVLQNLQVDELPNQRFPAYSIL